MFILGVPCEEKYLRVRLLNFKMVSQEDVRLTWALDEGDKAPFVQLDHLRQLRFIRQISQNQLRVVRLVAVVG